jgi:hypothetical protein
MAQNPCYLPLNLVGLGTERTWMLAQLFTLLSHYRQQQEAIGLQNQNVEQNRDEGEMDGRKQAVKSIVLNA